ncbi:MAG: hypothetical protein MUF49_24775 [Oculatellaceae cyanobacterium Prado106]|nr:hypothetical protein [Oculatellaceae cyanobacterium Prado106]
MTHPKNDGSDTVVSDPFFMGCFMTGLKPSGDRISQNPVICPGWSLV